MTTHRAITCSAPFAWCAIVAMAMTGALGADGDLEQKATWAVPSAAQTKAHLDTFLQTLSLDETTKAQIALLWPAESAPAEPAAPPETAPPETAPPETAPPETAPPET
ncbi:MAG: hypothetical protein ACYC6N_25260, partial [Pirellulaceae bacterium]